jgi:FkbM family methyltransferase
LKQAILKRIQLLLKKNPDNFFKKITGIIHIGANTGQEIPLYAKYGLSVVWIEPIPEIFETLKSNLKNILKQSAIEGLVTDRDHQEYRFNVASNNGASSSILELNLHQDIWPEVVFERTVKLLSKTLPTLLKENNINISNYDMLIMDTQGSELLILKGALTILQNFKYIKTEVPDFESYKGCCQLKDLKSFLTYHGFKECFRNKFATHPTGGSYYDIIYAKEK